MPNMLHATTGVTSAPRCQRGRPGAGGPKLVKILYRSADQAGQPRLRTGSLTLMGRDFTGDSRFYASTLAIRHRHTNSCVASSSL